MSIGVGVGKGASAGVLIKAADALERLEKVDTLVIDKTGTLTEGKPRVTAVVPAADTSEPDLLGLAASLERSSEHPLAAAIVAAAERRMRRGMRPTLHSVTGKGVTGTVGGRSVALGNAGLMAEPEWHWVSLSTRTGCAGTARPRCSSQWTRGPPGSSRSPIRSSRRHGRRSRPCGRTASMSSC